jgi:hypothetical protein
MKALNMEMQRTMKEMKKDQLAALKERATREELHAKAVKLVNEFPQIGNTRTAMWAISRFGEEAVRYTASQNLNRFSFRKAISQLANEPKVVTLQ